MPLCYSEIWRVTSGRKLKEKEGKGRRGDKEKKDGGKSEHSADITSTDSRKTDREIYEKT